MTKISEFAIIPAHEFMISPKVAGQEQLNEELKRTWNVKNYSKGYVFGFGRDNFRDRTQNNGQQATFYPAVTSKSKFHPDFTKKALPDNYVEFIDKYESIIYISFGTMFMP